MSTHERQVADDVLAESVAGTPAPAADVRSAPDGLHAPAGAHGTPAQGDRGAVGDRGALGDRAAQGDSAALGGWDCAAYSGPIDSGPIDSGPIDSGAADAHDEAAGQDTVRRPGRPRSERAEQAIIDATIEAIGECGIDGVRCEDVAARAGVGKATLYRRWPGKEDLLIAAFAAMRRPLPEPRGESVREDLIALLAVMAADIGDPRYAQQFALLHGAGERYPRLVARYKDRVIEPRRELVRTVLRRGIESGELRPNINVEVAMLLLTGAVMTRGKHDPTPAEPGFVESAVDELLRGIAVARR
jgi:AcrR family transcriptional regulator